MNIHQIPFLRLLLPYIAGIIIAWYTLSYTVAIFISVLALCLFITDRLYFRGKGYNMRHICGIYITLLFTAIGIISYNSSCIGFTILLLTRFINITKPTTLLQH